MLGLQEAIIFIILTTFQITYTAPLESFDYSKYLYPCPADSSVFKNEKCVTCLRPQFFQNVLHNNTIGSLNHSNSSLSLSSYIHWCNKSPLDNKILEMSRGQHFLYNRNLQVITIDRPPFVRVAENGNYSGVALEILHALQAKYNFTPNIFLPYDNQWGAKQNGSWNGMIGQIVRKEADVAVASISVTLERAKVIDFSMSFHQEPSAILIPAPREGNKLTTLIRPLHIEVWLAVLGTVLVLCPSLYVMHVIRLKIRGQIDSYKSINGVKLMCDLFQFIIGSLAQESLISPVNKTTRFLVVIWWFIALILGNIYTGYMVSFLSAPKLYDIVASLEDLIKQTVISITYRKSTALHDLFQSNTSSVYKAVWTKSKESDLVSTDKSGVEKVLGGHFAFIKEKSYLDVALADDFVETGGRCRMTVATQSFFNVGFSMGLQKQSPFLYLLDVEILNSITTGLMEKWKSLHWPKNLQCVNAASYIISTKPKTRLLTLDDCQGAYFILGCGLAMAILAFIFETKQKLPCCSCKDRCRKRN